MESRRLDYKISERYGYELNEIANKLKQMENGRVYELSRAQSDGYLATNVGQLRDKINELLNKIQNGTESTDERIADIMTSKKI